MGSYLEYVPYVNNPNVHAFLDTIADGEGANYNTIFCGGTFSNFNKHPSTKRTCNGYTSDAAGRYQFLNVVYPYTWAGLVASYGIPDFSPASQDVGAVILLAQKNAIAPLLRGDLQTAIQRANGVWPSLAGGRQQTRTYAQNLNVYNRSGGVLAPVGVDASTAGGSGSGVPDTSGDVIVNANTSGDVVFNDLNADTSGASDPTLAADSGANLGGLSGTTEILLLGAAGLVLAYLFLK